MKLMVQNLFWEHFKLSPKPSSISNMEPFGCHHTGEEEVIVKRLGCHSHWQQWSTLFHASQHFCFQEGWEVEDDAIAS